MNEKVDYSDIEDILGYVGYIKDHDTICLDGDFSLDDLRRIVEWFKKQTEAK